MSMLFVIVQRKKVKNNFSKIFFKSFLTEKNRHFWLNLDVLGQKWPLWDKIG